MPVERRKKANQNARPATVDSDLERHLAKATGTKVGVLQRSLIPQLRNALWLPDQIGEERRLELLHAAIVLLEGIGPQDEIEGMLAIQMAATHNAALECLRRAMFPESGTCLRYRR